MKCDVQVKLVCSGKEPELNSGDTRTKPFVVTYDSKLGRHTLWEAEVRMYVSMCVCVYVCITWRLVLPETEMSCIRLNSGAMYMFKLRCQVYV
jgi:hypothetical protein